MEFLYGSKMAFNVSIYLINLFYNYSYVKLVPMYFADYALFRKLF